MRFAFYVSNKATRLKKFLLKNKKNIRIKQIKFVLIDNINNKELKTICNSLGIKIYEINLDKVKNENEYVSEYFLDKLVLHKVDYAFIFCNRILKGKILSAYKNKIINFHPSLLPSYKGLNAIDQAVKDNAFLLGNTAHFINEKLDSGPIIMQNIVPFVKYKNYDDILDNQIIMLEQIIVWLKENRLIIDNDRVIVKNANYVVDEFIPNLEG